MAKKSSARKTAGKKATKRPAAEKAVKKTVRKAGKKAARKTVKKSASKASTTVAAKPEARTLKKTSLRKADLNKFRRMLLEKRHSLVGDMTGMEAEAFRAHGSDGSDLSLMPDHPANIATDNYEQEFTLGLLESERALLAEIDAALERIDARTYGVCLETGQFIGKPRLEACPWAKYCIEYARMAEKGLVRPGAEEPASDEDEG